MQSVRVVPADDDDDDQATEMNNTFTGSCQLALLPMCVSACVQFSALFSDAGFLPLTSYCCNDELFSANTATCLPGGRNAIFLNWHKKILLACISKSDSTTSGNCIFKNSWVPRFWMLHFDPSTYSRSNLFLLPFSLKFTWCCRSMPSLCRCQAARAKN